MATPTEPNEWGALTRSLFSHTPPAPEPEPHEDQATAPVIESQGKMPAPPPGMSPDTRAMLNLISAPHLQG